MANTTIGKPVVLRDNGVRSFIPPTFCFELRNSDGALVGTVSKVVIETIASHLSEAIADFDALDFLQQKSLGALGHTYEYDAGHQAKEPGLCFLVTQVAPIGT